MLPFEEYCREQFARYKKSLKFGTFEHYFDVLCRGHAPMAQWVDEEVPRDREWTMPEVMIIADSYVQIGLHPAHLPQKLALLSRMLNAELPSEDGVLTQEYWERVFEEGE